MSSCPIQRAIGRIKAGQSLQDLSYSCLVSLYEHTRYQATELAQAVRAEVLRRCS